MGPDISETPDKPRPRDLSFFLVAFFLVLPLRAVVPLSWIFVAYCVYTKCLSSFAWKGRLLFVCALCEVLFSLYHSYLVSVASAPWKHGTGNIAHLQISFARVLKAGLANLPEDGHNTADRPGSPAEAIIQLERDDPRSVDFRNSLRTWFGRVPWSSIRLLEVEKWIYWSIFNTELPKNLPQAHRVVLDDALGNLQKRLGTRITPGSNPEILPMRVTLDKMHVCGRPFFFYALILGVNCCLVRSYANNWNLRRRTYDGVEYLLYVPRDWNRISGPRPIVFLHGLGLGVFQYHSMIKDLYHYFPDRPLLIPLQPHVSQDIFHPRFLNPICRTDLADRLAGLMTELGWIDLDDEFKDSDDDLSKEAACRPRRGVTMLSHSNGSYVHAWCLKKYPEVVSRSCFVDPVTFCSWEGDACYNFLYKPCKTGIELLMRFFVGTELGVANLLRRHFDWSSNALWYEEIPNARDPTKTFFLLGGKDDIINAERVKKYLTSHGLAKNIWYDPNGRHGQALLSKSAGHTAVMRWLQESP